MTVGSLALTAGPLMPLRHTDYQVGSIRSGIAQAVKTIFVQKAQVLFKRCIVKLPVALRILAVSTGGMQDRIPQLVDCNLIRVIREHLARPGNNRRTGNAPRVDVVIQSAAESLALRVPCLGCRGRLSGVNTLQSSGIGTLDKDKASTVLSQRIQLHTLPLRRLLKIAFLDMLVRKPRHGVVSPDNRHVAGTGVISLLNHHARK